MREARRQIAKIFMIPFYSIEIMKEDNSLAISKLRHTLCSGG